jgi:hypothetical protein
MSIIHPLSALSLAALNLVSSANIRVLSAKRVNTPVFNARMNIALLSRRQVWDAIVAMGSSEVPGCRRARRFETLIHVRRKRLVSGPWLAESVQADLIVFGG